MTLDPKGADGDRKIMQVLEGQMTQDDHTAQALTALRQQIMALASVTGVLIAALRRAGLMTDDLEALLTSEFTVVAAEHSEQARVEWARVVAAVQKIATCAADPG